MYNFEKLEVWQLAIEYVDQCHGLAAGLPKPEEYSLKPQLCRAANSIALNIAEGSTGQSRVEQVRFLTIAVRSLLETVACQHLIHRRKYLSDVTPLREAYRASERLFAKLQAMRRSLSDRNVVREDAVEYVVDSSTPFDPV